MNDWNAQSERTVTVRYVGTKEIKYDNICQTRTIWRGKGDEQQVPISVAVRLARFPKVWEIVGEEIRFDSANESEDVDQAVAGVEGLPAVTRRPVLKLPKGRGK